MSNLWAGAIVAVSIVVPVTAPFTIRYAFIPPELGVGDGVAVDD